MTWWMMDGGSPRSSVLWRRGGTFRLNVVNSLTDLTMLRSTSIHWHSVFQYRITWADGVSGVMNQYCDGLRGPLVVYDPKIHTNFFQGEDKSYGTLVNGKVRYVGGPYVNLAEMNGVRGKRYRFRLISISCGPDYVFSIDGRQFTVIEADGQNVLPVTINGIRLFEASYEFRIRALPNASRNGLSGGFTWDNSLATFAINGTPFVPTLVPVLLQILAQIESAQQLLPPGLIYTLPRNKVVEVFIPWLGGPHPFHLRHPFNVVRSDVIWIEDEQGSNVTIRFTTDDAGPWIFHW
ncbi:multicopper oxidase [Laccaria amethystina LaAM-08-1]|uniref:laccase n=1 Tax=Laccaria amethystina LaAM-08-1 TaxID=1095629 RepID=A0A0C9WHX7_9AGAR|nr:multicopper oxidase [Laccaria amethystina LaAM-08-1]